MKKSEEKTPLLGNSSTSSGSGVGSGTKSSPNTIAPFNTSSQQKQSLPSLPKGPSNLTASLFSSNTRNSTGGGIASNLAQRLRSASSGTESDFYGTMPKFNNKEHEVRHDNVDSMRRKSLDANLKISPSMDDFAPALVGNGRFPPRHYPPGAGGGPQAFASNLTSKMVKSGRQRKKIAARTKGGEFQARRKKRRLYFCCISSEIDVEKLADDCLHEEHEAPPDNVIPILKGVKGRMYDEVLYLYTEGSALSASLAADDTPQPGTMSPNTGADDVGYDLPHPLDSAYNRYGMDMDIVISTGISEVSIGPDTEVYTSASAAVTTSMENLFPNVESDDDDVTSPGERRPKLANKGKVGFRPPLMFPLGNNDSTENLSGAGTTSEEYSSHSDSNNNGTKASRSDRTFNTNNSDKRGGIYQSNMYTIDESLESDAMSPMHEQQSPKLRGGRDNVAYSPVIDDEDYVLSPKPRDDHADYDDLAHTAYLPSSGFSDGETDGQAHYDSHRSERRGSLGDKDIVRELQACAQFWNNGGKEVFIFDFGAIVFWGYHRDEVKDLLDVFRKYIVKGRLSEAEFEAGEDDMAFVITSPDDDHGVVSPTITIANDVIVFPDRTTVQSRLAVSFAIAQSSILSIFEARIEEKIDEYKFIPETLALSGRVELSAKQLGNMIGEVFVIRHDVNLHSEILDIPDYFWKENAVEPLYRMTMMYLEIEPRTEVVNKRLDLLRELLRLLQHQHENSHDVKLEWIVIWLIVVSVVLDLLVIVGKMMGWEIE